MKLFGRLLENALDVEKCLIEEQEKIPWKIPRPMILTEVSPQSQLNHPIIKTYKTSFYCT